MRMQTTACVSGAFGLIACIAIVWSVQYFHLTPKFPAPGGEDDFAFRAGIFFFGMWPAFGLLGLWIGFSAQGNEKAAVAMWGGAIVTSVFVFAITIFLRRMLEDLTTDGAANRAVVLFFVAWYLAAVAGAYAVKRLALPRRR